MLPRGREGRICKRSLASSGWKVVRLPQTRQADPWTDQGGWHRNLGFTPPWETERPVEQPNSTGSQAAAPGAGAGRAASWSRGAAWARLVDWSASRVWPPSSHSAPVWPPEALQEAAPQVRGCPEETGAAGEGKGAAPPHRPGEAGQGGHHRGLPRRHLHTRDRAPKGQLLASTSGGSWRLPQGRPLSGAQPVGPGTFPTPAAPRPPRTGHSHGPPRTPRWRALALARDRHGLKSTSEDRACGQVQLPDVCSPWLRGWACRGEGPGPGARRPGCFRRKKCFCVWADTWPLTAVLALLGSDVRASGEPSGALGVTPGAGSCVLRLAVWSATHSKWEIQARH